MAEERTVCRCSRASVHQPLEVRAVINSGHGRQLVDQITLRGHTHGGDRQGQQGFTQHQAHNPRGHGGGKGKVLDGQDTLIASRQRDEWAKFTRARASVGNGANR